MTADPVPGGGPDRRADARRNQDAVLRAAAQVFAQEGPQVSLSRVARRAGVGAGTVYRHFPSKELLLEAVLARHVEGLAAAADRWSARADPAAALLGFLLEVIEGSAGRQHVCDALVADRGWPRTRLQAAVQRFGESVEALLGRAQRAGAIRADVHAVDLSALLVGGAALLAGHPSRRRGTWLVRELLEGLRPPAVTELTGIRDTRSSPGHGSGDPGENRCLECGIRLRLRATGRPPRYCGATCRQRAHRRRAAQDGAARRPEAD